MRHWKVNLTLSALLLAVPLSGPAAATDYDWNIGAGPWSLALNWAPSGGPPNGAGDAAYIGNLTSDNPQVWLYADASVGYLSVTNSHSDDGWLYTYAQTLTVSGDTVLTKKDGSGPVRLIVNRGTGANDFETELLDINNGAKLNVSGGVINIGNRLDVDSSSIISGYGTIKFAGSSTQALLLNGSLETESDTLTLQVTGTGKLDLGGSAGGSIINVTDGASGLVVDGPLSDAFDGTMTIGEGNTVEFTQPWTHIGTLNFNGGAGANGLSGAAVTVSGDINVNFGSAVINADAVFDGGAATLNADLYISRTANIHNGATFTGPGSLVIATGALLHGDANVDVNVVNEGDFRPGFSAGVFTVGGDYEQSAAGTLEIEINGPNPGTQHDRLAVGQTANLAGTLELIGGYVPDFYDEFVILTAGSIAGAFDAITGYDAVPDMTLFPVYGADNLTIVAAIPGDVSLDEFVGQDDLDIILGSWGRHVVAGSPPDPSFDGFVGQDDIDMILSYWGDSPSSIPEPATLALVAIGACLVLLRRKR